MSAVPISDTLHYRADGTVSSITRITRETYKTPSGRDVVEDVQSTVTIQDLHTVLGSAYGELDAHNKSLEAHIVTEREAAVAEKDTLVSQHAEELRQKLAALAAGAKAE